MSAAAAQQAITQGALDAIFNDPDHVAQRFPVPVLQCLQIKPLAAQPAAGGAGQPERYRVVLSDLSNYVQCMLATQANHVIHDNSLVRGCIVRVKSYQANSVKGKNILIILDLEVATEFGVHDRIGEPQAFEAKPAAANTTIGGSGFYGAKAESPAPVKSEPMSSRMGGTANAPSSNTHGSNAIYPIEALSPYAHKWTIKARVSQKSDIKYWHKASGEGKLFSVNLLDESGEIKATAFNEQVDQFFDLLQEGQVYYISNPCRVSLAKKQFTNLPNDYELAFERDTQIEKAEDQSSVPQVRFNFVKVEELQNIEKDATVDIVGVLKEVHEVSEIVSKSSGKPYQKRDLTIVDDTHFSVRVTIWGQAATSFAAQPESIVAFKGVKVSDYNGRSLSLLSSGSMAVDPDINEAHRLKGWYDSQGRGNNFSTHSTMSTVGAATGRSDQAKSIAQVKDENLGMENVDYFSLKATIVYIKQDTFAYPACRSEGCNKKVVDQGDGTWRCERCDVAHPRPEYRYIMSVNVNDHTGQLWLSCFDDVGRIVMGGRSADEIMEIKENNEEQLASVFEAANCTKLSFRCRAKMDTYGDNQRVRYQVMSASPLDFKVEAAKLAEAIKQFDVGS
ncbi:hypothetical protein DL766_010344 [Monosporascus sp. MC13-8B]|nr:hypothetical protein DL763_004736 [Monosporascus cannonballus]RYP02446.1 hypothetical protein DL766_010344 [Monosporascus sp. MC13-8B]